MLLTLSVYQLTIRSELPNKSGSTPIIGQYNVYNYLPPTKEEVLFSPARPRSFVCLSVCLCTRLLKKACMDLDEMLRVDRYRDIDELINF